MTTLEDFYHVGIRVPDLDAAKAELTSAMGVTWAPTRQRENAAWVPGIGHVKYQLRFTYSCEGPVHLELLEGEAGSIWNGDDRRGLHHLGVWTDDVPGMTETLIASGGTLEIAGDSPENGYGRFTYVRTPQGILIEPVSRTARASFEEWWAPGEPATGEFGFDQFFHVGIRVDDLQAAMDEMSALFGVGWASVQDRLMPTWIPGQGNVTPRLALSYSAEGPVRLELMQGEADSPWATDGMPGPHHFGIWTDDVASTSQRLLDNGWTLELAGAAPEDRYGRLTYIRSPQGVLLEPMSDVSKDRFAAWWAGGDLTPAAKPVS